MFRLRLAPFPSLTRLGTPLLSLKTLDDAVTIESKVTFQSLNGACSSQFSLKFVGIVVFVYSSTLCGCDACVMAAELTPNFLDRAIVLLLATAPFLKSIGGCRGDVNTHELTCFNVGLDFMSSLHHVPVQVQLLYSVLHCYPGCTVLVLYHPITIANK